MTILQEILRWSSELPDWQSDALARLLTKQTLDVDDLDDMFALLKVEHGLPDANGRTPKRLAAEQIPSVSPNSTHVVLHAIKNLRNVNAIAENQRLPIGASGLTVIYGDNGSGKSGYSRVLKRACRARDKSEVIHPNTNSLPAKAVVAEADFEVTINGIAKEFHWANDTVAPDELSSIAIFDSRCARAYLDDEDDFSYVPYGLDVIEGLAKLCKQLKGKIEAELIHVEPDLAAFVALHGDTAVGSLIAKLSDKTMATDVDALGTLTNEEVERHAELDKSLKEQNPKERAKQLQLCARRFMGVSVSVDAVGGVVAASQVVKLRQLAEGFYSAQAAATLAAQQFKEDEELLPGTGGDAWRVLFDAARKFALESHPEKTFPALGMDALCPLCQQPLADGARRLMRFEAFIKQVAERKLQDARATLAAEFKRLSESNLAVNWDEVTKSEIKALDSQLMSDICDYEAAIVARRDLVKTAIVSRNWDGIDGELSSPAMRLRALAEAINAEAGTLEAVANESERASLQNQFRELDARLKLSQVKDAVHATILRMNHRTKLTMCLSAVRTNSISLKASELVAKVVSQELADALNREFAALGVHSLRVSLKSRSERGKTLHKLKLEVPSSRDPSDILSEGEQRAIAIGSFLAEVGLSGGAGGIVFDDPVSSLDHRRRERVADRLIMEAGHRQVIVFTHDLYFLELLMEGAAGAAIPIEKQALVRTKAGFGVADPELPFEAKNTKQRIGELKARQQQVAKLYREGDEQEYKRQTVEAYSLMRFTWERAVEDVLFRKVVVRFRKGIETQRLSEVVVDDSDYRDVTAGMTKCSNYTHDKARAGGVALPDPDELMIDIQALEKWRSQVEERSKDTVARRKR